MHVILAILGPDSPKPQSDYFDVQGGVRHFLSVGSRNPSGNGSDCSNSSGHTRDFLTVFYRSFTETGLDYFSSQSRVSDCLTRVRDCYSKTLQQKDLIGLG